MSTKVEELYQELKGTRLRPLTGELVIPDFEPIDYAELLHVLIQELAELFDGDYYAWLGRWAHSYHRFRAANRTHDEWDDPLVMNRPEELNDQQELAIIKYFLYRKTHTGF